MQVTIHGRQLELFRGDITDQQTDAIVNAANSRLAGGGGVDGAIHRRGGPAIMEETKQKYPEGCLTGSAVISGAGNLAARHVIHAVGPVWSGGEQGEEVLLAVAYRKCFDLAKERGLTSIALPSLSTGAYRFPMKKASQIAVATALDVLEDPGSIELIRFVLFDDEALAVFTAALTELTGGCSTQA